jgi:hypothetical protein
MGSSSLSESSDSGTGFGTGFIPSSFAWNRFWNRFYSFIICLASSSGNGKTMVWFLSELMELRVYATGQGSLYF